MLLFMHQHKKAFTHKLDSDENENDFGILLGAGYSITDNININAGLYRGLKDHDGGKFNNLFIDLGYSF